MFGFESELLVLLLVALIVVGPKDLPRLLRLVGRWVGRARVMTDQFRASFDEMARDSELDELRKELAAIKANNPISSLNAELSRSMQPVTAAPVMQRLMLGEPATTTAAAEPVLSEPPQTAVAEAPPEPLPPGFTPTGP